MELRKLDLSNRDFLYFLEQIENTYKYRYYLIKLANRNETSYWECGKIYFANVGGRVHYKKGSSWDLDIGIMNHQLSYSSDNQLYEGFLEIYEIIDIDEQILKLRKKFDE